MKIISSDSDKIQNILSILIPLSQESDMNSKHTAMLLCGGKPIVNGYNHQRSCNNKQFTMSFHAEMHVLAKYFSMNHEYSLRNFMNDSDFTLLSREKESYYFMDFNQKSIEKSNNGTPRCLRKKLEIVVIRVNNKGQLLNSKPCNSCLYYMKLFGVKSVYYSNENGDIIKEKVNNIEVEHQSVGHRRYLNYLENKSSGTVRFS